MLQAPGRHANLQNIKLYGTSCAAWDQIPHTPLQDHCEPGSDWSQAEHNWCQLPWCYVRPDCVYKIPSKAFNGSSMYYSYEICGGAPDCYNDFSLDKRCPYDPYGTRSYVLHTGNGCECSYHGMELPAAVYRNFPMDEPGKYANLSYIKIYGTSCAAWDQMPDTPWSEYCPVDADWCNSMYNWCQLPWCFVGSSCSSRVASTVFAGSEAVFLSYDTCLSAPDCRTTPYDPACPFDRHNTGWSTAQECPDSWSDVCECLFQGASLPSDVYLNYPFEEPGKFARLPNIAVYGTSCASWDMVPGTPLSDRCRPGSNWSSMSHNWCQLPWCYVNSTCASHRVSSLFNGSNVAFYSYDACGSAPDCYNHFSSETRCPYDPYGKKQYHLHKGDDCECLYHGRELPTNLITDYPAVLPGMYERLPNVRIYGTFCAAWNQVPGTPHSGECPLGADWCHSRFNWCQLPWCFVSERCATRVASQTFEGANMYYSYDTCLSTPNCHDFPYDSACPFDPLDSGWSTPKVCETSWSDVCKCSFQSSSIPLGLIQNYPRSEPGKYASLANIGIYGTSCAAWDQMPETPLVGSCTPGSNWSSKSLNWCQIPWCYVDSTCPSRIRSTVFEGSKTIWYSYDSCGNAPDCYNDFSLDKRCPYDPSGTRSYVLHKGNGCECSYHGMELPAAVYRNFPMDEPGKYANLSYIKIYGTSCAAWDQMPDTPWSEYCPVDADWCNSMYNWCQLPWCFVGSNCSSRVASTVFAGSEAAFLSYDTCLSAPDCRTTPYDPACPFHTATLAWSTAAHCPNSWSDVCRCLYHGRELPPEILMSYPAQQPGQFAHLPNAALYGTSCATWDAVPGTPLSHLCRPGSDWSKAEFNWCQLPWCYVSKSCVTSHSSMVFNGSDLVFYSYDTCGNAPNCYDDFATDARCPYDPHGTGMFTMHKGSACQCIHAGRELPHDLLQNYPLDNPGKYANLSSVSIYGTSCAAWDAIPKTPWSQYCLPGSDWCSTQYNWCQVPWCYVSPDCQSRMLGSTFQGPGAEYYSYDTCLSSPQCRNDPFDPRCPFDSQDIGWSTAEDCPDSWSEVCECIHQGKTLPEDLYLNFPAIEPGRCDQDERRILKPLFKECFYMFCLRATCQ